MTRLNDLRQYER